MMNNISISYSLKQRAKDIRKLAEGRADINHKCNFIALELELIAQKIQKGE